MVEVLNKKKQEEKRNVIQAPENTQQQVHIILSYLELYGNIALLDHFTGNKVTVGDTNRIDTEI